MVDQCDNCKFYRKRVYVADPEKAVFECRYSDPFVQGQAAYWPVVKPDDWCGKWEAMPIVQTESRRVEIIS